VTESGAGGPRPRSTPAAESASSGKQRVQKVLARAGIASRRHAEQLVREGRVSVGGKVIDTQGVLVDPLHDEIEVDGRRISAEPLTYVLFHKPKNVMCTMSDPAGRPSVADYVKEAGARVVPVGRLDFQTSGVLLLTNDGDFARSLLHPSRGVLKEYVLEVDGVVDAEGLARFKESIEIGGRQTQPALVSRLRADADSTWLTIVVHEGKNRQIRRLAEHAGYAVRRLTRSRFAGLTVAGLGPGQWRVLSRAELSSLSASSASAAVAPARRERPSR
jgi:23S rRNA pseudouridine2605 synthase